MSDKRIIGRTVGTPINPEIIGDGGADLSNDAPLANGIASAGTSEEASRADHVHPTDTSRMPSADLMEKTEDGVTINGSSFIAVASDGTPVKIPWAKNLDLTRINVVKIYRAGSSKYASLKELSGDTTLLTEEDRDDIINEAREGFTVGMPSVEDIESLGGGQLGDASFIVADSDNNPAKVHISSVQGAIANNISKVRSTKGKYASLKELSDNTTLLTEEDRANIINEAREGFTVGMPSVEDIESLGGGQLGDASFIVADSDNNPAKVHISSVQGAIANNISKVRSTKGKYASLKELSDNTTLLTEEDRESIIREAQEGFTGGSGDVSAEDIAEAVSSWLNEHPEATTTIQDGSVTPEKTSFITSEETGGGATTEVRPKFTNLADPTSADWLTNKNYDAKNIVDKNNSIISNYIPCKTGDVLRVKGLSVDASRDTSLAPLKYARHDSTGLFTAPCFMLRTYAQVGGNTGVYDCLDRDELANGIACVVIGQRTDASGNITMSTSTVTHVRVAGTPIGDVSDIIITINEPIEYEEVISDGGFEYTLAPDIVVPLARDNKTRIDIHDAMLSNVGADAPEIVMPYELAVAVGVECNIFKENIVFSSRSLDNYSIRAELTGGNGAEVKNYPDFFRITASEGQEGDYTFIVSLHDKLTNAVALKKSAVMHIVPNTDYTASPKKVLFIGDSVTASYKGAMMAEIQYKLSKGGIVSIGTQESAAKDLGYAGNVQHEGYNSAAAYSYDSKWGYDAVGFTRQYITKTEMDAERMNPFWNPDLDIPSFDLGYYMEKNKFTQLDAVCINLGLNSMGAHDQARRGLNELVEKIRDYNKNLPIIISMCTQLATGPEARTDVVANRIQWKGLQKTSVLEQFDGGKVPGVYISTPYMALDMNRYYKTFEERRSARDPEMVKVLRRSETDSSADYYHPIQIGVEMLADAYYPWILYALGNT